MTICADRSSGRIDASEPLLARPIGLRAVATMTASGIGRLLGSGAPVERARPAYRRALVVRSRHECVPRPRRPHLAAPSLALARSHHARVITVSIALDDVDLSDPEFWLADREIREAGFKALRDTPGLRFFAEQVFEDSPFPPGPGYWALVRHDDVWAASRNPQLFCSGKVRTSATCRRR